MPWLTPEAGVPLGSSIVLAADDPAATADPLAVLTAWVEAATRQGATLVEPPRREAFGAEAWLLDPEGNRLLLLVSGNTPLGR